jgi:hypothetical protein
MYTSAMETAIQTAGWVGASFVVIAYFLITYKKVGGDSVVYQALNLLGCIGVGVNAFYQSAWPSFGIQIVWGVVAILGFINIFSKK